MGKKAGLHEVMSALMQTQCQQCGYEGCLPYAQAVLHQGEAIDRCLPGGGDTYRQLAEMTGQAVDEDVASALEEKKPGGLRAVVDNDHCIGCMKCIVACPVDAISGSLQMQHHVLASCTGCQLCVEVCPTDCIRMVETVRVPDKQQAVQDYQLHQQRQARRRLELKTSHMEAKLGVGDHSLEARRLEIERASARVARRKQDE